MSVEIFSLRLRNRSPSIPTCIISSKSSHRLQYQSARSSPSGAPTARPQIQRSATGLHATGRMHGRIHLRERFMLHLPLFSMADMGLRQIKQNSSFLTCKACLSGASITRIPRINETKIWKGNSLWGSQALTFPPLVPYNVLEQVSRLIASRWGSLASGEQWTGSTTMPILIIPSLELGEQQSNNGAEGIRKRGL